MPMSRCLNYGRHAGFGDGSAPALWLRCASGCRAASRWSLHGSDVNGGVSLETPPRAAGEPPTAVPQEPLLELSVEAFLNQLLRA